MKDKEERLKECQKTPSPLTLIKQKALDDHIPIIMDDTLEVIQEILERKKVREYIRNWYGCADILVYVFLNF